VLSLLCPLKSFGLRGYLFLTEGEQRKRKMKKLICVALALILALSCVACGGAKEEKTTITFWSVPIVPQEEDIQAFVDECSGSAEIAN